MILMIMILRRLLGNFAYCVSRFLASSLRLATFFEAPLEEDKPYIYCFWHGKQFMPILTLRKVGQKQVALVSPSKDGDILESWLTNCGFEVVRGSSSRKGISALMKLVRFMRDGYSVGITPDGPTGPMQHAKPGAIYLAQKVGAKIIPIGTAFAQKWEVSKAWDHYQIPKPFSRAALYIGSPISVEGLDIADVQKQLECTLNQVEAKAVAMLTTN
jgi:lysophospholipid acyltransferase (LPLAT)-like uncharacterized protein